MSTSTCVRIPTEPEDERRLSARTRAVLQGLRASLAADLLADDRLFDILNELLEGPLTDPQRSAGLFYEMRPRVLYISQAAVSRTPQLESLVELAAVTPTCNSAPVVARRLALAVVAVLDSM